MIFRTISITISLVFAVSGACSQEMPQPPGNCSVTATSLPAVLSGWTGKKNLVSSDRAALLNATLLPLGQRTIVVLHPTREVRYVTQPEKPGGSVAYGGMVAFSISDPGTYQVSLSSSAWIDILKNGAPLVSATHAPGPKCSSIRKTVAFLLQRGRYVLQVSANADPTLAVMVTRVP